MRAIFIRSTRGLGHRPGRHLADLGRARQRRGHRPGCLPQSGGRAGVLAPVPPLALVAASLSSSLVVVTADDGPDDQRRPARSFHPAASAGRSSRRSAAMKFARASARREPAWLQHVAHRKNPVSAKPSATSCSDGSSANAWWRKPAVPAACRFHGSPASRETARPISAKRRQALVFSARRAGREIEAEAKLGEKLKFEPHDAGARHGADREADRAPPRARRGSADADRARAACGRARRDA